MTTSEKLFTPIDVVSKVIKIDVKCTELKGGLLDATNGPPYTLYHDDGTNLTQCHPVKNGVPQVSWDPAWGAESFKAKPPSQYSGLMRQVVQCMYLRNDTSNYSPTFYLTHGIFKGAVVPAVPPETDDTHPYWVVEISHKGVFAKRLPFLDKRESKDEHDLDAFVAKKCWSTTTPPAEDPAIEYNGSMGTYDISKKCCSVGRVREVVNSYDGSVLIWPEWESQSAILGANPLVVIDPLDRIHKLIDAADMGVVYGDYSPFAESVGWAFSYSGHEAQVVVYKSAIPPDDGYVTSRWKCSFVETTQTVVYKTSGGALSLRSEPTLSGSIVLIEAERFVPHPDENLLWKQSEEGSSQLCICEACTPPDTQDAPIYVWYVGTTEKIVRYRKTIEEIQSYTTADDTLDFSCAYDPTGRRVVTGYGTHVRNTNGFVFSTKSTKELEGPLYKIVDTRGYGNVTEGECSLWGGGSIKPFFLALFRSYQSYLQVDQYIDACIFLQYEREGVIFVDHSYRSQNGTLLTWDVSFLWVQRVYNDVGCSQYASGHGCYYPALDSEYIWVDGTGGSFFDTVSSHNVIICAGENEVTFSHNPGSLCIDSGIHCEERDGDFWYKFLIKNLGGAKADAKHASTVKYLYLKQQDNQPYHDEEYVINGGFNTTYGDLFIGKI